MRLRGHFEATVVSHQPHAVPPAFSSQIHQADLLPLPKSLFHMCWRISNEGPLVRPNRKMIIIISGSRQEEGQSRMSFFNGFPDDQTTVRSAIELWMWSFHRDAICPSLGRFLSFFCWESLPRHQSQIEGSFDGRPRMGFQFVQEKGG